MKNLFIILVVIILVSCEQDTVFIYQDTDVQNTDATVNPDSTNLTDSDSKYQDDENLTDGQTVKPDSESSDNEQPDESLPVCGNGIIEAGEVCDRDEKNCYNISDQFLPEDKAECKKDCSGYNIETCEYHCGDGIKQDIYGEKCETNEKLGCSMFGGWYVENYETAGATCTTTCSGYDVSPCFCQDKYKEKNTCVYLELAKKECGTLYIPEEECWAKWRTKIVEMFKQESQDGQ